MGPSLLLAPGTVLLGFLVGHVDLDTKKIANLVDAGALRPNDARDVLTVDIELGGLQGY